ncbi:hypothetical protein BKA57DRAFT_81841 [Linnemannia elongata]|nr:hypothetical protein BKA57DRAFT_81841 [Linnemannia elongata]
MSLSIEADIKKRKKKRFLRKQAADTKAHGWAGCSFDACACACKATNSAHSSLLLCVVFVTLCYYPPFYLPRSCFPPLPSFPLFPSLPFFLSSSSPKIHSSSSQAFHLTPTVKALEHLPLFFSQAPTFLLGKSFLPFCPTFPFYCFGQGSLIFSFISKPSSNNNNNNLPIPLSPN